MKIFLALLLSIISSLFLCTDNNNISGTVDDTENEILIAGKVITNDGKGVPLVIVRMTRLNFSDTTGSEGNYEIRVSKNMLENSMISLDTITSDTIEYSKNDAIFNWQTIHKWKDTLPDVYFIQRNISGALSQYLLNCQKIEAIVSNSSDTTQKPVILPLWYNNLNSMYSGFAYFASKPGLRDFQVYVKVYPEDTLRYTGRSQIVEFNSLAGDIDIPPFDPFNAIPIVYAGNDTTVTINDLINLNGIVTDSFNGTIKDLSWKIHDNNYNTCMSGDTVIIAPSDSNENYVCILRATDDDNNISFDTVEIKVLLAEPNANAGYDTIVSINDSIHLHGTGSDTYNGDILKWEWSFNGNPFITCSSPDTVIIAPSDSISNFECILRVTDDDNLQDIDTVSIKVCQDAPSFSLGTDTLIDLNSWIRLSINNINQEFGVIKQYKWDTNFDGIWDSTGPYLSNISLQCSTVSDIKVVASITDDDNNESFDTICISVPNKIKGTFTSDLHLAQNEGPYFVDSVLIMENSSNLIIEPGTKIFLDNSDIWINKGSIYAKGLANDSIYFFSNNKFSAIMYENSNLKNSLFEYVHLSRTNSNLDFCIWESNYDTLNFNNCYFDCQILCVENKLLESAAIIQNSILDSCLIRLAYSRNENNLSNLIIENCVAFKTEIESEEKSWLISIDNSLFEDCIFDRLIKTTIKNSKINNTLFDNHFDNTALTISNSSLHNSHVNMGNSSCLITLTSDTITYDSIYSIGNSMHLLNGNFTNTIFKGNNKSAGLFINTLSEDDSITQFNISNCTFSDFTSAIYVNDNGTRKFNINNSNFYNNSEYNIKTECNYDINAIENYWGITDSIEIEKKFYKYKMNDIFFIPYKLDTIPIQ